MNISIKEVADFAGGKITGDENLIVTGLAKIEEAKPGDLTFLYMPAYEKHFAATKASAILVKPGFNKLRDDITYVEINDPNKVFSKLLIKYFTPEFSLSGIDDTAFVHPTAELGDNVALGKNVVISSGCKIGDNVKIFHNAVLLDNVEIGSGSIIFQNVSIRENCRLGKRVIIHANTAVGSDGFGFYPDEKGVFQKIPQVGIVIIEDDVELGSNVAVDRAALGATIIKRGVKIDNLVQIAHNVIIEEDTVISAQTGISGSTKVGKHCMLAGQVGVIGHIEISDGTIIYAQSGVAKPITKPGTYFGSPAMDARTTIKLEAHIKNLPQYVEKINQLEKLVKSLNEEINHLKNKK